MNLINLEGTNWKLLNEQKLELLSLVKAMSAFDECPLAPEQMDAIDGIINRIDSIEDSNLDIEVKYLTLHDRLENILGTISFTDDDTDSNWKVITDAWSDYSLEEEITIEDFCTLLFEQHKIDCEEVTIEFYQP